MAKVRGIFDDAAEKEYVDNMLQIPAKLKEVLNKKHDIHKIARKLLEAKDAFMLGRGLDYSILLEGALKLKEISYIHTEAYASGELKHGTIALITEDTPVVAVVTQEKLKDKELSNIREVQYCLYAKVFQWQMQNMQMYYYYRIWRMSLWYSRQQRHCSSWHITYRWIVDWMLINQET